MELSFSSAIHLHAPGATLTLPLYMQGVFEVHGTN
jgi:hypothetical protein